MSFPMPQRDIALLIVSCVPFFTANTGDARYSPQSAALALVIVAGMCALAWCRPLYGWQHLAARVILIAAGIWGYAGCFVDSSWDVLVPHRLGVVSQYVWFLGCFLLFKSRYDHIETVVRRS